MSLIHDEEDWVAIYTRDTAGWAALHPLARFVSLELARKLNRHGELSLGRQGLPALSALLHAPWEMIGEHVDDLLEEGRLEYDADRRVLRDPQHAARQAAARGDSARPLAATRGQTTAKVAGQVAIAKVAGVAGHLAAVRPQRRRSMTPNAIRKRAEYLRKKAQLVFPAIAAAEVATAAKVARVAESPSLSDLKISEKRERGTPATPLATAATSGDVVQRNATIPDPCRESFVEACRVANALLCVDFVWKKFVSHAHGKRWRVHELEARWATWVDREIRYTLERVQPRARDRPGLAITTAPLIAERMQWEREAQASRSDVLAAAARAMAVFS